jgi:SagB-type dehydrogenase family enzyme
VSLPTDFGSSTTPATDILSGRVPSGGSLDDRLLARLLFFSAGVTRESAPGAFEERTYFRAAMSAGNLHPVELYVACGDVGAVPGGLYHFDPLDVALTRLRELNAPAGTCTVVVTGIPFRTAWKYGERGYRHLFWDGGTILANLLAVAAAAGVTTRVVLGFPDERVGRFVGVDGRAELPLALVEVGRPAVADWATEAAPLAVEAGPLAPRPIEFPLITASHAAGALADADAVMAWQAAAARVGAPAAADVEPPSGNADPVEQVILRRGSTRIMVRQTARRELLDWAMAAAARPVPADFVAAGATLLEHNLSVHAVAGVEPGAYRWRPGGELERIQAGDYREAAELLCLRQPLGGDSAYTAFHCADLSATLSALGTRGYRATQLEAGIAAGRLTLAAFALGYGATGLTFFDDAVSQFFQTAASCMLVTSVGVPAYRNTPGGRPGATAELRGFDALMERLSRQLHRAR